MVSRDAAHIAKILLSDHKFVLLDSSGREDRHCLFLWDPRAVVDLHSVTDLRTVFSRSQANSGEYVAGFLTYECGYVLDSYWQNHQHPILSAPLGCFGYFKHALVVTRDAIAEALELILCEPGFYTVELEVSKEQYCRDIEKVLSAIRRGDIYQLNYTVNSIFNGVHSTIGLYKALRENQPVDFGAWVRLQDGVEYLSFSPELFFQKSGSTVLCKPMKGTLPTSESQDETERRKLELQQDEKNRAENVMIVDLLRNDLSRVCKAGSVRVGSLFDIEEYRSVLQMTSTVTGELCEPSLTRVVEALFPCGSITGAPKLSAMDHTYALEQRTRGIYTGSIGVIFPNGDAEFNVAIRTLSCSADSVSMGVGSGIVFDSSPEAEYDECIDKIRFATCSNDLSLIETMLCESGNVALLERHLQRMLRSAKMLNIALSEESLREFVSRKIHECTGRKKLRVLCHNSGKLSCEQIQLEATRGGSKTLVMGDRIVYSSDPMRRHKTTQRAAYTADLQQAQDMGYDDMVYQNERGHIVETTCCNIAIQLPGDACWYTPPLSDGCLDGIQRGEMLEHGLFNARVVEKSISIQELFLAKRIVVGNAVAGVSDVDLESSSIEAVEWYS